MFKSEFWNSALNMQEVETEKVHKFKYLGSTTQSNGGEMSVRGDV